MQEIIYHNIDKINELCRKHQVKELFVFGSASSGEFTSTSDIDLLVSFFPMEFDDFVEFSSRLEIETELKIPAISAPMTF